MITLYGLTTCIHCKMARNLLEKGDEPWEEVWVDTLSPEEREPVMELLRSLVGERIGFPVVVRDGELVGSGFRDGELQRTLGISDEVDELRDRLISIQEPQGYLLNPDPVVVHELLKGLLANKKRYGYMACPCRLATGDMEKDRDIICPCRYREPDIEEYGRCYCGLYVSEAWKQGKIPTKEVPERRKVPSGHHGENMP